MCFFILWIYIFLFYFISVWNLKKLYKKSQYKELCSEKFPTKERTWIYRIFARFVPRFAARKSRGKLFERNPTLTSRWIGWLTLSGLPLLAFPPPPPKHFIHGIPAKRFLVSACYLQFSPLFLLGFCDSSSSSVFFVAALDFQSFSLVFSKLFRVRCIVQSYDGIPLYFEESTILQIFRNMYIYQTFFVKWKKSGNRKLRLQRIKDSAITWCMF